MNDPQPKTGGLPRWLSLLLAVAVLLLASKLGLDLGSDEPAESARSAEGGVAQEARPQPEEGREAAAADEPESIAELFEEGLSGVMVTGSATVEKVLSDDNVGSRHQRFILRLDDGHTVLVAHNIDVAPRVPLEESDRIEFRGQYEWNQEGGVLHWTHHDPGGFHEGGWIRKGDRTYE